MNNENKKVVSIHKRDWIFQTESNGSTNAVLLNESNEVEALIRVDKDGEIVCNSFSGSNIVLAKVVDTAINLRGELNE